MRSESERGSGANKAGKQPVRRGSASSADGKKSAKGGKRPPGGKRPSSRKRPTRKQVLIARTGATLFVIMLLVAVVGSVWVYSLSRDLPEPGTKPKGRDQTSVITDRNGETIAKLFAEQNRTDRKLAEIPLALKQAVVATEDQRFYKHGGVDPLGIVRALWVDVSQGKAHGGSTITQQYVKTAFLSDERTLTRKIKEAMFAYQVENELSKDQILELYLNTIYFGHGAYGVEAASQVYFGVTVDKLTIAQSAVIAGVIKSPGRYSPYLEPENGRQRRDTVLEQLEAEKYITPAQRQAATAEELVLVGLKDTTVMAPYFAEYVKARLIDTYGDEIVYRGGISVKTTLDMNMQRVAEAAIAETLNEEGDPSAALVAINPGTGEILAMVGGRDFSTQQFNVAVQGRRQPGSAFKPFVLLSALEQGVSSEAVFPSGPASFSIGNGQTWRVTGSKTANMRLRQATEKSVNSVFAKLILDTKPEKTVAMAQRMGIREGIEPVPAIALGGLEKGVSPLEMASAYGTLAAKGKRTLPYGIAEVKNNEGKVVHSGETSATQAVSSALAYVATDMLQGVITRGTGTAAAIGRPAAGKTGTTQEYRDAWFVGYTPQLVCAVWVGYPEEQVEMKSVHGVAVTGGTFPAKIWAKFMKGALAKAPVLEFQKPKGVTTAMICSETGLAATAYCPSTLSGLFLSDKLPVACTKHVEPIKVTIPKLVGLTKEAALAALQKLMLLFKVVEADMPGVGAGVVGKQDPPAGSVGTTQTVVTITVSNGGSADLPPKADFKMSPSQAPAGTAVTFDGSHAKDNGTIVKYYWEFGDGTEAEGVTQQHIFESPGTYEVTLLVTDDKDQTASVTKEIVIR